MYLLTFKRNGKTFKPKKFNTKSEINDYLYTIDSSKDFEYEIKNTLTGEVEYDHTGGMGLSTKEIMDNMFPNGDGLEGFDWTLED